MKAETWFDPDVDPAARDFLDGLFRSFWQIIRGYAKEDRDDLPLFYPERCIGGQFAAALSRQTPVFMSEPPIERKRRGQDARNGRGDFWCVYKDNHYGFELKRAGYCLGNSIAEKAEVVWKYEEVCRQAKDFLREIKSWRGEGQGAYSLSVFFMIPWSTNGRLQGNPDVDFLRKALGEFHYASWLDMGKEVRFEPQDERFEYINKFYIAGKLYAA